MLTFPKLFAVKLNKMADGFKLPKSVAAELLKEALEGKNQFKTSNQASDQKSYKQQSVSLMQEFGNSITPALKRMKIAYLEDA